MLTLYNYIIILSTDIKSIDKAALRDIFVTLKRQISTYLTSIRKLKRIREEKPGI